MATKPMKRKLDDEEYQALLNVFNGQTSGFRKVANQSLKFKVAFHFVNIYAVSMMLVYFITANFLLDHINPEFVQHKYLGSGPIKLLAPAATD
ncbi:MAG: hypothetical protein RI979_2398 [Pseudomonadota bacterium]|jgi:hypothetical protein